MSDRLARLTAFADDIGRPVRICLVGAGQMGSGLAAQLGRMPGLELAAVVDINADRAAAALGLAGRDSVHVGAAGAPAALAAGRPVALDDPKAVAELDIDVVVEATGVPLVGAAVAHNSLLAGQDVVMLNVETDVTVGVYLDDLARSAGQVYTIADGDEPVCGKELVDLAHEMAFDVVCAGKGKNNPFRPSAVAGELQDEADRKHMNPKMLASFVDGSKTMIEMAALSNATGLPVDTVGMHGVTSEVDGLASTLIPAADGGVLSEAGRVDYAFGPAPGVFVVVTHQDETVRQEMSYLGMGAGPYFTLYRPFHLASLEAPRTIITTVLDRRPVLRPAGWHAEVVATAKHDIPAGTTLQGIGGDHVRGVTYRADQATEFLPLGLAENGVVQTDIGAGDPLPRSAVDVPASVISTLRSLQEMRA
ncbi:NAD(P)H-dependent oxidoreductase [Euzebya tangerina]|uniref:NAD(P)H-dependent oxidoreductase n=1 Tax=Euzebya tangerina TaxID=591198 RepID=UPI00196B2FBC|nr:SAF domain-containing protein [Euzebya tangerina]